VVPQENGPEAEKRWIHSLREQGAPLTNLTDGGEGTPGREVLPETRAKISAGQMGNKNGLGHTYSPSDETRTKMSAVHTGKKLSSETRARMSAVLVGNKRSLGCHPSEETRVKLSAAGLGRKHSPETRIKISAAHIGRKLSAEHRAEISAALTGRKRSPEAIMKGILANTGKKRSPEICAKFSALRMGNKNLLGHHHSDETKRKMSVAHRAYWATQKGQRTNANM
jgi:plasmid stability protein